MTIQREFGELPITFSTSNAIANFLGSNKNFVSNKPNPVTECDGIWINVKTLARNILSALDKEAKAKLPHTEYAAIVHEELEVIFSSMEKYPNCKLVIYLPSYKSLAIYYPKGNLFEPKTELQKASQKLDELIFQAIVDLKNVLPGYVIESDVMFPPLGHKRVAVLTHYPADLIHFPPGTEVLLLESHTGFIKPKFQWYTKLRNGSSLYKIPFDRAMLQVFGDKSNMFNPVKPDLRRIITEVSEQANWTQFTTRDKIIDTVKRNVDTSTANNVMGLY